MAVVVSGGDMDVSQLEAGLALPPQHRTTEGAACKYHREHNPRRHQAAPPPRKDDDDDDQSRG
jgi:hypothetical protein